MADHADQAGLLLQVHHGLGLGPAVGQGNLDLDVLAGLHAGNGLGGVHLGRGAQDDGVDLVQFQGVVEICEDVRDIVLGGDLLGRLQGAADQGHDLDIGYVLDTVQVLDAEGAGAGKSYFHFISHFSE